MMRLFKTDTTFLWPRGKIIDIFRRRFKGCDVLNYQDGTARIMITETLDITFSVFLVPRIAERQNEIESIRFASVFANAKTSQEVLDTINRQLKFSELVFAKDEGTGIEAIVLVAGYQFKAPFGKEILTMLIESWLADHSTALSALRHYCPNILVFFRGKTPHLRIGTDVHAITLPIYSAKRAEKFVKAARWAVQAEYGTATRRRSVD